mmetsp:Transcript_24297/g.31730  ORF Transcript_24297/g.31730 Transcript_24297/m.31730 type:complete len:94 (+) Transcript_24297:381-662(+)
MSIFWKTCYLVNRNQPTSQHQLIDVLLLFHKYTAKSIFFSLQYPHLLVLQFLLGSLPPQDTLKKLVAISSAREWKHTFFFSKNGAVSISRGEK